MKVDHRSFGLIDLLSFVAARGHMICVATQDVWKIISWGRYGCPSLHEHGLLQKNDNAELRFHDIG